jgi:hypothetical protein
MGDRKTFETNHEYFRDNVPYVWSRLQFSDIFHLFLDRVNCMYNYIFCVLFGTGGFLPRTHLY